MLRRLRCVQIFLKKIKNKKFCGSTNNGIDQYQNSSPNLLTPYREQPRSTWNVAAYSRPAFSAKYRTNYVPTSFDQQVQVSQDHTLYRNNKNWNTEVHSGGGLELVKPAREPASSRPKPCASLKKSYESCPFAATCGPLRKKNDRGQTSAFPSETSRFKPVILAHRGSALPWLVDDRVALRLRRIWCVPTRQSTTRLSATVLPASREPPPSRRAPN